ncbi:FK506-binding protein 15-like [Macrobrachium nipponense]|uniref:FK506-binding protein 15-like n=1 Tax=Macrobrachium nipponense TaxID=159736 RepID=UPI0030C874F6
MKVTLEEKEKKINSLNESVTQLLQKNQKLLEDKTDLLIAKQGAEQTVSLSEVLQLREEKAAISGQLEVSQGQLTVAKKEVQEFTKLLEKQEVELKNLRVQIQEEGTKNIELQGISNSQREKEMELYQMVKERELEKERLQASLDTNKSTIIEMQKEISDLNSRRLELEGRLHGAESERDSLNERLRLTLQQMEERTRGDGESSTEKELENQLRDDVKTKTSRINQLEEELAEQQALNAEVRQDLSEQVSKYQAQIQELQGEKAALQNSNGDVKSTSDSEEVVATVKKVMNTVFRTLKPQFTEKESYSGAFVNQTLLAVIRDVTLQLLEGIDKKSNIEEKSPESKTTASAEERGNGVCNVGNVLAVHGPKLSETISAACNSVDDASPIRYKNDGDCEQTIHIDERDEVVHTERLKDAVGEEVDRECIVKNDYNREVDSEDMENRTDASSSEGEYTDASDRQFSPKNSVSSSDSVSYDCEQSINAVSLESGTEKEVSVGLSQQISEVDSAPHPHTNQIRAQRTPVIDMQSTEAVTVSLEKSDSSRDSSLDRVSDELFEEQNWIS